MAGAYPCSTELKVQSWTGHPSIAGRTHSHTHSLRLGQLQTCQFTSHAYLWDVGGNPHRLGEYMQTPHRRWLLLGVNFFLINIIKRPCCVYDGILLSPKIKNKTLPFATTWMNLESIMLSKIRQRKTNSVSSHMQNLKQTNNPQIQRTDWWLAGWEAVSKGTNFLL